MRFDSGTLFTSKRRAKQMDPIDMDTRLEYCVETCKEGEAQEIIFYADWLISYKIMSADRLTSTPAYSLSTAGAISSYYQY